MMYHPVLSIMTNFGRTLEGLTLIACLVASVVAEPETDGQPAVLDSKSDVVYRLTDWTAVRTNSKWVPKNTRFQGYLRFDGDGDFPKVTLWETKESMEQQRAFYHIAIESDSACRLINKEFGGGANNWRVMHGLYVEVTGVFTRQEEGLEYLRLGELVGIQEISIYNNGLVLLHLKTAHMQDGK